MVATLTPSSSKSSLAKTCHEGETFNQFTNLTPLGYAGGDKNLYRYVGNNPLTNVDPQGLREEDNSDISQVTNATDPDSKPPQPTNPSSDYGWWDWFKDWVREVVGLPAPSIVTVPAAGLAAVPGTFNAWTVADAQKRWDEALKLHGTDSAEFKAADKALQEAKKGCKRRQAP